MNASQLQHVVLWLNGVAIAVFLLIEIYWFAKQPFRVYKVPSLLMGFVLYNIPFWILAVSLYFQPVAVLWGGVLRLAFLAISIPVNLWLHYHGDKGGNSVGMATVFFLLAAVPLVLIMEILIAVL